MYPRFQGLCTGPAVLVCDPPDRQKFSQWALPAMVPPACRMRVTMVASISGVYPSMIDEPFIIGTPARQTVSLSAIRFPRSGPFGAPRTSVL